MDLVFNVIFLRKKNLVRFRAAPPVFQNEAVFFEMVDGPFRRGGVGELNQRLCLNGHNNGVGPFSCRFELVPLSGVSHRDEPNAPPLSL